MSSRLSDLHIAVMCDTLNEIGKGSCCLWQHADPRRLIVPRNRRTHRWTPAFDITTIPDDVLLSESARRIRAKQMTSPRPKVLRQCEHCLQPFGAREMRQHLPLCPERKNPTAPVRKGWTLRELRSTDDQEADTYRYWQSLPVGDRIVGTWELTKAANSIRKAGENVSE